MSLIQILVLDEPHRRIVHRHRLRVTRRLPGRDRYRRRIIADVYDTMTPPAKAVVASIADWGIAPTRLPCGGWIAITDFWMRLHLQIVQTTGDEVESRYYYERGGIFHISGRGES